MKRSVNSALLREKIKECGGLLVVASKSTVGYSTIEKLRAETYRSQVQPRTRRALCEALGVREDQLFPVVTAKGKSRAS